MTIRAPSRASRLALLGIGIALSGMSLQSHSKAPGNDRAVERDPAVLLLNLETQRNRVRTERYRRFADSINDQVALGTALNEIGVEEGHCYAIGVLVGKADAVRHLRPINEPNLTDRSEEGAFNARVEAQFLETFELSMERAIQATPPQRVQMWNLDCSGRQQIPPSRIAQPRPTSFFEIVDDGKTLRILGDIEPGFADQVIAALKSHPSVTTVALGSGGGVVDEALRAGTIIRNRRLDTTLWNNCYSACPLVFLGGVNRIIWSPYPTLGFHQVSIEGRAVPLNAPVYEEVFGYAAGMGADPRYVVRMMLEALPSEMNEIKDDPSLCTGRVATAVQRRCVGP